YALTTSHTAITFIYSHFLLHAHSHPRHLHSFPTRRSSDLRTTFSSATLATTPSWAGPTLTASTAGSATTVSTAAARTTPCSATRSEEHTSELQSRFDLVCRLLLEKKKKNIKKTKYSTIQ